MKRLALILGIVFGVVLICTGLFGVVAHCSNQPQISTRTFTTRMIEAGYIVENRVVAEYFSGLRYFLVADSGDFEVEFYVFDSVDNAYEMFNNKRAIAMADARSGSGTGRIGYNWGRKNIFYIHEFTSETHIYVLMQRPKYYIVFASPARA